MELKLDQLQAIMPAARSRAVAYIEPINHSMDKWHIDTPLRVAAWLVQLAHESRQLQDVEENLNYRAKGLRDTWPSRFTINDALKYEHKPQLIANRAYANRYGNGNEASGDGWRYRGRGPLQITFKANYEKCGRAIGCDLVKDPDLLLLPQWGALAAGWFWYTADLNDEADKGDLAGIRKIINGPSMLGLAETKVFYKTALKILLPQDPVSPKRNIIL